MNDEPSRCLTTANTVETLPTLMILLKALLEYLTGQRQQTLDWDSNNPDPATSSAPYRVYNIGNNNPVELMDYIEELESSLDKKAEKELLPIQPGDVPDTYADVDDLVEQFDYKPSISVKQGVENFVKWYKEYNINNKG